MYDFYFNISLDYVRFTFHINEHVVRAPTRQCPLTRRQMDRPKAVVPERRGIGGMDADNVNVEIENDACRDILDMMLQVVGPAVNVNVVN